MIDTLSNFEIRHRHYRLISSLDSVKPFAAFYGLKKIEKMLSLLYPSWIQLNRWIV